MWPDMSVCPSCCDDGLNVSGGFDGLEGFDADPLAGLDAFKMDPLAGIQMEPIFPNDAADSK